MMSRLTTGHAPRSRRTLSWQVEETDGTATKLWWAPALTAAEAAATAQLWRRWNIRCRAVRRPHHTEQPEE